jgi:signal transduction histidine kinase
MTLAALTPLMFILLLVAIAAAWMINAWVVEKAQQQIRNDLNAAREVFENEQSRIDDVVRFTAHSKGVTDALNQGSGTAISDELSQVREREGLDFLSLIDVNGRDLSFAEDVATFPLLSKPSFVKNALAGKPFSGTVIFQASELLRLSPDLAEKARIILYPASGQSTEETRGMLLISTTPILALDGEVTGCLYGGVLLNNNLAMVDRIRDIIYGADGGSATIFLGRTRAATTIRLKDGERAIGTSVSDEVASAVLEHGETWLARARVVDEWYLTAYEPIRDPFGQPIGALYVGLLEAPFSGLKQRASLLLLGLLTLGCSSGYLLAHHIARRIARPIVELEDSARRLANGERDVPLPEADDDEIGHLACSFKSMTAALQSNEEELNLLNRSLERKVIERTSELEAKSLELMRAQQDLLRTEKLAAIGELASGVAHEINNPTAIIRGNIELVLAQLQADHPAREEAEEALKQTERVSRITHNMLAFAREQTINLEPVLVNKIIEEVMAQVRHHEPLHDVKLEMDLRAEVPRIKGDSERLRQVFTNIVVNALQAMKGKGRLKIVSRIEGSNVEIRFEDSGPGISLDLQEKIFNPFFTTKSNGTGLGLSVSYGIIKALKGIITIQSQPGAGCCFRVQLPIK